MKHPRLAGRLYGVPLLVTPERAAIVERAFRAFDEGRVLLQREVDGRARADIDDDVPPPPAYSERLVLAGVALRRGVDKPYGLTEGGTAIVPAIGTFVQRGAFMDALSGLENYGAIAARLEAALADPDVRRIALEIDSPGGEANGIAELADRVRAAGSRKRLWAVANEAAYSAAYWLASAAERVYVPVTGGVGSIGVVALHVDQSKRDSMQGLVFTYVTAGARKVEMSGHRPLTDSGRTWLQAEVDRIYELFAGAVAVGRGITAEQARATEAALLSPPAALEGKFIDGIATLAETVAMLESGGTIVVPGAGVSANALPTEVLMTEKTTAPAANPAAPEPAITQQDLERARAEGRAEGIEAGAAAEHARVTGILGCDEAKDRPKAAHLFAMQREMGLDTAKKLLAQMPAEPKRGAGFDVAMGQIQNPEVGADTGAEPSGAEAEVARTVKVFRSLGKPAAA